MGVFAFGERGEGHPDQPLKVVILIWLLRSVWAIFRARYETDWS